MKTSIKETINKLSPNHFERFIASLFEKRGFDKVELTPKSNDYGVDIVAYKNGEKYAIQVKKWSKKVGVKAINEIYTGKKYYDCQYAIVISNNEFSNNAIELAHKTNCSLVSGKKLIEWIKEDIKDLPEFLRRNKIKRHSRHKISNEQLIKNFYDVKKKLKYQPSKKDMDNKKISLFSSPTYSRRFGGWTQFLEQINEIPKYKTYSEEELIQNYQAVENKLGKSPTIEEFKKYSKISPTTYSNRFGSWNSFLKKIDIKPYKRTKTYDRNYCIKVFDLLKKKLGKTHTSVDINRCQDITFHSYRSNWGTYSNFLKERGEKFQRRNIPENDLIKAYLKCKKQLGLQRPLTFKEMNKYGEICGSVYQRRYGSWSKFIKKVECPNF